MIYLKTKKEEFQNKDVKINGNSIISNWREIKISIPSNLQKQLNSNKDTKKEIKKQKEIKFNTSNSMAF
ncbi:TPA: hypothetical protein DCX66_03415 [Candidatus Nomurabacteria bacterium]|uniref:Uncharacterized protein n=1 Tax=Candidatus Nomurabacteria bacterium GW2011_GWE1_35_16 TaxID=1618761 RepID=A0A0G0B978_9BACT|nr:MAG: hypothetical protein UR55_C0015G0002 [Candidatus Nomurabacteria bacterium GW2011_GWF1_34_20]KKP61740.1 MAG: hypothetical protein UR57_C0014G0002 [Candidatus Nomurabacteria bacterium GW2011_GWE2_34_25]KKP65963.1 MAG: hypothetical protein UR64_C0015G0002 [Candidatus Nomurabacteria bacterium GW2011_GWE1_35_16]HAE36810.1 hypothetical protein [Candidatus Nomurabacteria bacterium]HAX65487.1 hypothetical protein [Candidatus Nomurabacteria bacterium]